MKPAQLLSHLADVLVDLVAASRTSQVDGDPRYVSGAVDVVTLLPLPPSHLTRVTSNGHVLTIHSSVGTL